MVAVGFLAVIGLTGLSGLAVSTLRRRAVERHRIEQQLEFIYALPTADYRLRMLEQLVG